MRRMHIPRELRGRKKRTVAQKERDRLLASEMALKGKTLLQIRDELNAQNDYSLSAGMISYDLAAGRRDWLERMQLDRDELLARELANLDKLETTAWEGYWRAIGPPPKFEIIPKNEIHTYKPTSSGESYRFLTIVGGCIRERAKLLGVGAPTRTVNASVNLTKMRETAIQMARERGWSNSDIDAYVDDVIQDATKAIVQMNSDD